MIVGIAFKYDTRSIVGALVSWWTAPLKHKLTSGWKSTPNHVEIVFGEYSYSTSGEMGYWYKRQASFSQQYWRMYYMEVNEAEYIDMMYKAENFIGAPYDWLNIILSDILSKNIGDPDKLTCDEGVAIVLMQCSKFRHIKHINNLTPYKLELLVKHKLLKG